MTGTETITIEYIECHRLGLIVEAEVEVEYVSEPASGDYPGYHGIEHVELLSATGYDAENNEVDALAAGFTADDIDDDTLESHLERALR